MFPNLHKIASICLALPVSTASVERSFSQMKIDKELACVSVISLNECSLSCLMRIAIEAPEELSESDLNEVIDVWQ